MEKVDITEKYSIISFKLTDGESYTFPVPSFLLKHIVNMVLGKHSVALEAIHIQYNNYMYNVKLQTHNVSNIVETTDNVVFVLDTSSNAIDSKVAT